jgi:hypothetical protein
MFDSMNRQAAVAATRAQEILGGVSVWTAGGVLMGARKTVDGWVFANRNGLVLVADVPYPVRLPGQLDAFTLVIRVEETPVVKVTAPALVPTGMILFANGIEILGAKKRIREIAKLW